MSADEPSIGTGGDSSYVVVGFRETVSNGASTQTRVLARRLVAGRVRSAVGADSLATPDADSAADPVVLVGEYGRGFLLDDRVVSHELFALALGTNGFPGAVTRVDSADERRLARRDRRRPQGCSRRSSRGSSGR